jgi:hypothetical protein
MNRIAQTALLSLATSAIVFAGSTIDRSNVSVLGQPGTGGGCSSSCSVGGHGVGGVNSGGAAKGFHDGNATFPEHPGEVINNSGTDFSGHITTRLEDGTPLGAASGAFAPGIQDIVGHSTGVFGDCNGRLSKC